MALKNTQNIPKFRNPLKCFSICNLNSLALSCFVSATLAFPSFSIAGDSSSLTIVRQLLNKIDQTHVRWIDSIINQYRMEICQGDYPEIGKEGFDSIKLAVENMTGRNYAFSDLPRGLGIDFSNYQNISEEVFFDGLIRTRLDRISCKEHAVNCINHKKANLDLATDFVDRLSAFRIYRDKFRSLDFSKEKLTQFAADEKKVLAKYFPEHLDDVKVFYSEWDPITAISIIVNYTDPGVERGFLFQEAFASLAQDEKMMFEFGKISRPKQIEIIQQLIKGTSDSQRKTIKEDREYWSRSCRPEGQTHSKPETCFYRPTYEQKRKLLNDHSITTIFEQNSSRDVDAQFSLDHYSKFERAFLCKLNVRYGKGGDFFDTKINNINMVFAFIPPARALLGAIATRNLTFALVLGLFEKKLHLGNVVQGLQQVGKFSAISATSNTMRDIYEKCTASKFKTKQPLPYLSAIKANYSKSREQFLRECQSCKFQPTAKKIFDVSCVKAATNWIIHSSLKDVDGYGNLQFMAKILAQDKLGQTPISRKLIDVSDAVSLFFYNLTLTTTFDAPGLLDFTEKIEPGRQ